MVSNAVAWGITAGGAVCCVEACKLLSKLKLIKQGSVRKAIHISTGMVFMLTWVNYDDNPKAKYWCAAVPALMTAKFAAVGLGLLNDTQLVSDATRGGDPKELLTGPVYYGLIHSLMTGLFWRESPAAVLGLAALCLGDGLAELVGKAAGPKAARLPHNKNKTWIGSIACGVGAFLGSVPMVALFNAKGYFKQHLTRGSILRGCGLASLVATLVESLPVKEIDNILMPATVALLVKTNKLFS